MILAPTPFLPGFSVCPAAYPGGQQYAPFWGKLPRIHTEAKSNMGSRYKSIEQWSPAVQESYLPQ